jgi:glycosyltransferase involved in cell wall biosynthesis
MHILLLHQAFVALDEPGGTRHFELARLLAERGYKVTIIASPVSYLTGEVGTAAPSFFQTKSGGGVTILRAYTYTGLHRSFAHRLLSFFSFMISSFWTGLQVRDVDLVWGTSPPIFQSLTAWVLARLKRVPFLFEVRDLWPAFAIEVGVLRQPLLIRASEWMERFLYHHADQLVVNSPGYISHVQTRGASRVALVPNGTDPGMFDPHEDGVAFRSEHGLEGKFIALYAGAHGLSNDLGVLLDAAALLIQRPNIAIVLVGDGKDKPNIMSQAAEKQLSNVYFLPPIPKEQMRQALGGADACVAILKPVPLYATVYPNKVFDYMAAGRPVILAIDGVIRDVVEDAGAGIFAAPGDPISLANAILTLADDPQKGHEMGLNGRRYVEQHFDRADLAAELAALMEQMVSAG